MTGSMADRPALYAVFIAALFVQGGCTSALSAADGAAARGPVVIDHRDAGVPGTSIPDAIQRALHTDARVLECAAGVVDGRSRFAPDWVGVHRVDLDGDGNGEWILNGLHPCLRQPADDHAYWWIYTGHAPYRLLSRGQQGQQLEVRASRHAGLADLRLHLVNGRGQPLELDLASDGSGYVPAARVR